MNTEISNQCLVGGLVHPCLSLLPTIVISGVMTPINGSVNGYSNWG